MRNMFGKKKDETKEVDKKKLNELVILSRNAVKILYIFSYKYSCL